MLELRFVPSKHAGSDPEAFWLWPVMAITASVPPKLARIVYSGSDFPHPFGFRFSKEGTDPMWTVWSGFGQTHLVWKQAGVQ